MPRRPDSHFYNVSGRLLRGEDEISSAGCCHGSISTVQPASIAITESDFELPEGATPVDGIVVAKDKKRKRKRKDAVEVAEMHGDCTELHAESKKGKKKKRKTERRGKMHSTVVSSFSISYPFSPCDSYVRKAFVLSSSNIP